MAAQLADLGRQTFHETFAADNRPEDMAAFEAEAFGPEQQMAELLDSSTSFLVAAMQGEAVGYAKLYTDSNLGLEEGKSGEGRLEIQRLYVREDWQGTGLGAALMRGALALAEELRCTAVVLGVWEKNPRAIAFYQRFGFKQIGKHTFQLGQDKQTDLVFRKGLAGRPQA